MVTARLHKNKGKYTKTDKKNIKPRVLKTDYSSQHITLLMMTILTAGHSARTPATKSINQSINTESAYTETWPALYK